MGFDAPELDSCPTHGFLSGNTRPGSVFGSVLHVEECLRLHVGFELPALHDPLQPGTDPREPVHISSGVVRRILAIKDAMRFQFSVSE
jgi:hypothetical protein